MNFDFTKEIPGYVPEWYILLMIKRALDILCEEEV